MQDIISYIADHKERFVREWEDLLRIPSVSADPEHRTDMFRAADFWKNHLIQIGADTAQVIETNGNPVVFGQKTIDPALPTILVYGHYDVMPVDPLHLWETDPFSPVIKDGKMYARGADDNKGQSIMQAKAFEVMVKTGTLPCNVKFMLEGEEEIGSAQLVQLCQTHQDLFAADVILVSDTSMISKEMPSLTYGLRGLAHIEVTVSGPNRDLHSGLYGGSVANPINVLCKLIASLHDENNRITVKGFYDDIEAVSKQERNELSRAPFDIEAYKQAIDIPEIWGEKGYTPSERTGIRPSLDVNGIWGGYTGEGTKTIIPAQAHAKISIRLVPNQDPYKIAELFTKHFEENAPDYVRVFTKLHHGGYGYVTPTDHIGYQAAVEALEQIYGVAPVPVRSGGSIPVISNFDKVLGTKSILMGFGYPQNAIHSPNENFPLDQFFKGIEAIIAFYQHYVRKFKNTTQH